MAFKKWKSKTLRSGFEDDVESWLKTNNINYTYEKHRFTYYQTSVKGGICSSCGEDTKFKKKCYYTPDFNLDNCHLEVKGGQLDSKDRTTLRSFKESNPNIDLRVCLRYDHFLTKTKMQRIAGWLTAHGFKYCIGIHNLQKLIGV